MNKRTVLFILLILCVVFYFVNVGSVSSSPSLVVPEQNETSSSVFTGTVGGTELIDTSEPNEDADKGFVLSPDVFWIDQSIYKQIFSDNNVDVSEKRFLYDEYYKELPNSFIGTGTLFGSDDSSYAELFYFGEVIRQQMGRGWVLVGSGMYGFHDELSVPLDDFITKYYSYKVKGDTLLSKQSSPLYFYMADGGLLRTRRDASNQPIPVSYSELNDRQKLLYDLTSVRISDFEKTFITTIGEQSSMGLELSVLSGKFIGIVSAKSPNDIGKVYAIYDGRLDPAHPVFVGLVVVAGTAKRDDWTGLGSPTFPHFRNNPLMLREQNGQHWVFDLPKSLYEYFGGSGGPVFSIVALEIK